MLQIKFKDETIEVYMRENPSVSSIPTPCNVYFGDRMLRIDEEWADTGVGHDTTLIGEERCGQCYNSDDAVEKGHLPCIKFVKNNEHLWEMFADTAGIDYPEFASKCFLDEILFAKAAGGGHLDILRYLVVIKCPWNNWVTAEAVRNDHLECFEFLYKAGCPVDATICDSACYYGSRKCLEYAYEVGFTFNVSTAAVAVENFECLQFLYEKKCPWDELTCKSAVDKEKLKSLKFLHESGCPWDSRTYYAARLRGNLAILAYLEKEECPKE